MLKALGADHVIDYTQEDFTIKGKRYDMILDVVGNRSILEYKSILNPRGTYVMIGGSLSLISQVLCIGPLISQIDGKNMEILVHKPNKQDQNLLLNLFVEGKVEMETQRGRLSSQLNRKNL